MKHESFLILFIVIFLFGCEDKEPATREFPIIRTLEATDINSTGATFQGELVKKGNIPTTSYGFIWDTKDPNIDNSYKVTLGENINSSTFKVRIDSSLVNGIEYYVRTFAVYNNKTVYGNIIKFNCKGSAKIAWSLEMTDIKLDGWFEPYGSSNNESGCIIFPSSEVYSFNPEKKVISKLANFPVKGNSGTQFTSVAIGNIQYFFNDIDKNLYKHEGGTWKQQSNIPYIYIYANDNHIGFAVSDSIYILNLTQSYMYNLKTKLWKKKATLSGVWSIGGTDLNNKAYLITADKNIWEYNTGSDSWIAKTKYPGIIKDKIISFSYNDKLYFGLSYSNYKNIDRKLWIYDPSLNLWSSAPEFPVELSVEDLFFFCIKGKLYIGNGIKQKYNIWKFDPSKN